MTWTWYYDGGSCHGEHPTREAAIREALSDEAEVFFVGELIDVDISQYMLDAESVREAVCERWWDDAGIENCHVMRLSRDDMVTATDELRAWARKWLCPDPGRSCDGVRMTAEEARRALDDAAKAKGDADG